MSTSGPTPLVPGPPPGEGRGAGAANAGAPLPRPSRPPLLAGLAWASLAVLVVGCGVLTFLLITGVTGVTGALSGAVLALVPVVPVVGAFVWLDRYEAEPFWLLLFAAAWGAGVATLAAAEVNTASLVALQNAGGDVTAATVVVAPVVEETLKGTAVLLVLLLRRREFDGVVDGIVYAGMAGIGFAFVENVLYLGRALHEHGPGGLAVVFVLRCVASPFAHPLFTAATGIGLGVASRSRGSLRVLAPLLGWAAAIALHAGWNLSAASGLAGFVGAYVVVQVPLFCAMVALAVLARRREGRLIARHLEVYGRAGWLTAQEVTMLSSLHARQDARAWAGRIAGPSGRRAMRDFQELGSELAFLRERVRRGSGPADAPEQEHRLLLAMAALRERYRPRFDA